MRGLKTGDPAPNFDLTSTEGVVLMLCDELPRSPVLLAFVGAPEAARGSLEALARRGSELERRGVKALAVSSAAMAELQSVQQELALPFPLLRDDRDFSRAYGFEPEADEPAVMLVLVDRDQRVLAVAGEKRDFDSALDHVLAAADKLPSPTVNYPRSVINRVVDRWVN